MLFELFQQFRYNCKNVETVPLYDMAMYTALKRGVNEVPLLGR